MSILEDKKWPVAFALLVMIAGSIAYFWTDAYLSGFNEEQFIKDMILHHQEAVDSSMVMLNSENPDVRGLAEDIVELQQKEIIMLESWLDEWYPMMEQEDTPMKYMKMMPELSETPSKERDVTYLKGMIKHHEGAIMMAEKVLKTNPRSEVKKLAEDIISVQSTEISSMKKMINDMNGVLV